MQQLQPFTTVTNSNKHLSGFELTTLLIRGGLAQLHLNNNAKQVLLYLATCYNERNGVVFPRVKTIAEAMDISERGVIRALAELTEKGCILRAKRAKNCNKYIITKKVLQLAASKESKNNTCNVTTHGHGDTSRSDTVTLPIYKEIKQHEIKKQQQTNEKLNQKPESKKVVVDFSKNFLKSRNITLNDVPASIINNKKVKNPCAYWASLTKEQKTQYLQKEQAETAKQAKIAELKKQEEIEKAKERAAQEIENKRWNALPLNKKYPLNKAIKYIWSFRNFARKTPLMAQLIELYHLDFAQIAKMTQAEIDSLQNV